MQIYHKLQSYIDSDRNFVYQNQWSNGIHIDIHISILSEKYVEFQKDLLNEFVANIIGYISEPDSDLHEAKRYFEFALQELNTKLAVFVEKLRYKDDFSLRGAIQLFSDREYISSIIGDCSLVILRKQKLYYVLHNSSDRSGIDLFGDMVEGDIFDGDQMIIIGTDLSKIIEDNDLANIDDLIGINNQTAVDVLQELLSTKVGLDYIHFIKLSLVDSPRGSIVSDIKNHKSRLDIYDYMYRNRYSVAIVAMLILILSIIIILSSSYLSQKNSSLIIDDDSKVSFTIEDIKKDIDYFQKLDSSSDEKIRKYSDIKNKLAILRKQNIVTNDLVELENILNEEYDKGFQIKNISNINEYKLYSFTSYESATLGKPVSIDYIKGGISIGGANGVIMSIVNDDIRGTTLKLPSSNISGATITNISDCHSNILSNGLYCYSHSGDIYNFDKGGINKITLGGSGITNIQDIGIYNSSIYILTNLISGSITGPAVLRYQNIAGSNTQFRSNPIYYSFANDKNMGYNLNNMSIDGSLLFRSQDTNQAIQLRRDTNSKSNSRAISIIGGYQSGAKHSNLSHIYSYNNTNNIYIRDPVQKAITIYTTKPNKSSDSASYSFTMNYRSQIKIQTEGIIDIYIKDGINPDLYILKSDAIYKIPGDILLES